MADIRAIRRRIKGVQNTAKITRAMEMIAASKMRRAQERGLAGRPFSERMQQVMADLAALPEISQAQHPLLRRKPVNRIAIVHITPDRGLCGGLNTSLNRLTASFVLEQTVPVTLIAIGRKGCDFMRRHNCDVVAEFDQLGYRPTLIDTLPISRVIIDDYSNGVFDLVYLVYAQFVSTMVQKSVRRQLLPVEPADIPRVRNVDYIYEPGPGVVLGGLLPRFVEMQVYHAILESIASEQSARMVAMRNATDNANELIDELTLLYNEARQEAITKEILDIAGGAAALA
ncbi:MAG: ATP synthase F1 subunit gamma [Dehalococcoidales bacterium]|nr:ATP synthase F1 subunit gamma [Dehalococcoidales bacterium]MDP6448959.1 ATP synthase F1 subunit gamma [Dehalococcoidales bacterium]MDP6576433.1 ATP synthase F1 subunit gamma [Dehalococcoidales bacterium]